jgi:hypothetical protein
MSNINCLQAYRSNSRLKPRSLRMSEQSREGVGGSSADEIDRGLPRGKNRGEFIELVFTPRQFFSDLRVSGIFLVLKSRGEN